MCWELSHLVQLPSTPEEACSMAAFWETDSIIKWHSGRNHWHGYREIPTKAYEKPSQEMKYVCLFKKLKKSKYEITYDWDKS